MLIPHRTRRKQLRYLYVLQQENRYKSNNVDVDSWQKNGCKQCSLRGLVLHSYLWVAIIMSFTLDIAYATSAQGGLYCLTSYGTVFAKSNNNDKVKQAVPTNVLIQPGQMNDGYCDCIYTGEDEPLTDACSGFSSWAGNEIVSSDYQAEHSSHLSYQCPQQPTIRLSLSKLNDGICDCCDGSDESSSGISCTDDCENILRAEREARAASIEKYNIGSVKRQQALDSYKALRAQAEKDIVVHKQTLEQIYERKTTKSTEIKLYKIRIVEERVKLVKEKTSPLGGSDVLQLFHDVFQSLNLTQLQWLLVYACQISGEMVYQTNSNINNNNNDHEIKSCVPLRLAGIDHGIQWEAGSYQLKHVASLSTTTEQEDAYVTLADIIAHNADRNDNDNDRIWTGKMLQQQKKKRNNGGNNRDRRRLTEEEDEYDEQYDVDQDDVAHRDDYDNFDEDDDTRDDHTVSSSTSALDDISETTNKDELVQKIKSMSLSLARTSFTEQANKLLDRIDQVEEQMMKEEDDGTEDNVKNEASDGTKASDGTIVSPPSPSEEEKQQQHNFDPLSFTMIRNTIESRSKYIERGYNFAVSALVLVDAIIDGTKLDNSTSGTGTEEKIQEAREILQRLIIGTIHHGLVSSVHLYEILQAIVPELSRSTETESETCRPPWAGICPPQMIVMPNTNVVFPAKTLVRAVQNYCDEKQNTIQESAGLCSVIPVGDVGSTLELPADIPDGSFGYSVVKPRTNDDLLSTIFDTDFRFFDESFTSKMLDLEEELDAIENEERSINEQIRELKKSIGDNDGTSSFGPDGELHTIHDSCFEIEAGKYVYEVCMFKGAKQRDIGSPKGTGTNLGRWSGASLNSDGKRIWKWENGEKCWNGPKRSATVTVACGSEHKLLTAEEPDTCRYVFDMESPVACDEQARIYLGIQNQ